VPFDLNIRRTELFGDRITPHGVLAVLRLAGVAVRVTATAWRTDARYEGSGETFDQAIAAVAADCPLPLPDSAAEIREKFATLQFAWKFHVDVEAPDGERLVTRTAYPETAAQQLADWHILRERAGGE
jgi:hypothetical protein